MAQCYVCAKGPTVGNHVSHANNKSKRVLMPNLQRMRIRAGQASKHVCVCTRCLRSGLVQKAL